MGLGHPVTAHACSSAHTDEQESVSHARSEHDTEWTSEWGLRENTEQSHTKYKDKLIIYIYIYIYIHIQYTHTYTHSYTHTQQKTHTHTFTDLYLFLHRICPYPPPAPHTHTTRTHHTHRPEGSAHAGGILRINFVNLEDAIS